MASLEELIAQREKLQKLRAKGVKSVRYGEDSVEYKSDAELATALDDLNRQIAAFTSKPVRQVRIIPGKGA